MNTIYSLLRLTVHKFIPIYFFVGQSCNENNQMLDSQTQVLPINCNKMSRNFLFIWQKSGFTYCLKSTFS